MEPEFWRERWREGRTGFHQDHVTPWLEQYWPTLRLPADTRVLVPLAGKSHDLAWLAARGHQVLGVELSPLAVEQFFAEHKLQAQSHSTRYGTHHVASNVDGGSIEMICGDVLGLDDELLSTCRAVFDRAALIALPPDLRRRYVAQVYGKLPVGCRGLLITLEYPQTDLSEPPFSVPESEVRQRYGRHWTVNMLERRDILTQQPRFAEAGVTALHTAAYHLERVQPTAASG